MKRLIVLIMLLLSSTVSLSEIEYADYSLPENNNYQTLIKTSKDTMDVIFTFNYNNTGLTRELTGVLFTYLSGHRAVRVGTLGETINSTAVNGIRMSIMKNVSVKDFHDIIIYDGVTERFYRSTFQLNDKAWNGKLLMNEDGVAILLIDEVTELSIYDKAQYQL